MKSPNNYHRNTITIPIVIFLSLLAPLVTSSGHIPPLSQDILERIFHQSTYRLKITDEVVVIYICEQPNYKIFEHLSDYCADHSCALLDKANAIHESIRNFVGHPDSEYFAILDAPRQLKYVLEVKEKTIKYKDIYNFEADFTSQKLSPFFSSEEQPTEVFEPCRKLVGKNFDAFLDLKAPIKIVYLYTEQESCAICGQMLRGFADISQKIYRQDVIAFGYFDIFKNDHAKIPSEVAPYFLVFKEGETEPFGIQGEKFPQLENALVNIIAEQIYPGYKDGKPHDSEINPEDLVEDVQQLQIPSREDTAAKNVEL